MVHLVVLIYMPSITIFIFILSPLIFYLWVPILASTSMLPSGIRYHTGRFVRAIERCVSFAPFTSPRGSTNSNLKVSQGCPIGQIIYHIVAFGQLLLFVGWNIWIYLFVCFLDAIIRRSPGNHLTAKVYLYPPMAIVLIYVWILAATGILLGEIRWWPSRDRLSRLVPPSIKNTTMTKSRWSLLCYRS